jgi:hypothetical protein
LEKLLALDLENFLKITDFCSFSQWWLDGFKLYLVYRCIMKGCRFFNIYFFKRREVAFSYIINFLRTAETISMNLGRNEVLMIPYKCCISK